MFREQKNKYIIYNILLVCIIGLLLHIWQSLNAPVPHKETSHASRMDLLCTGHPEPYLHHRPECRHPHERPLGEAEAARREAEKKPHRSRTENLRNQLNPHFLLNTLNNIYALIAFDSDKAQQAVQELSKLLRYVLYDNQQNYVPSAKRSTLSATTSN